MSVSSLWSEYNIENAYPNLTFDDPVGIYHSGDNTNRLFVLEQPGTIKIVINNSPKSSINLLLKKTNELV